MIALVVLLCSLQVDESESVPMKRVLLLSKQRLTTNGWGEEKQVSALSLNDKREPIGGQCKSVKGECYFCMDKTNCYPIDCLVDAKVCNI